jgi:hypothetical protein
VGVVEAAAAAGAALILALRVLGMDGVGRLAEAEDCFWRLLALLWLVAEPPEVLVIIFAFKPKTAGRKTSCWRGRRRVDRKKSRPEGAFF